MKNKFKIDDEIFVSCNENFYCNKHFGIVKGIKESTYNITYYIVFSGIESAFKYDGWITEEDLEFAIIEKIRMI